MSISNFILLLVTLVIFSCAIMPVANAMDLMNSNGTDAVNSKGNAGGNECPEKPNCWAKYEGKWKTELNDGNVYNKMKGQNAIYNGTCGIWDGSKYDEFNGTSTIYDLNSIENMQQFMDCDGQKSLTVDLPDLTPTEFVGNFAEMRYVKFNLAEGKNGVQKLKLENMAVVDGDKNLKWENKKK